MPVQLNAARVEVPAARGLPAQFVLPNGGGIAYGEFHLDHASLAWLMANLPSIDDELTRGQRVGHALGCDARPARSTPDAFLDAGARARCRVETNELNISRGALVRAGGLLAAIPPPAARARLAPRLELVLRAGPGRRDDAEPEVRLVLGAARHGADAADGRVADARVEAGGEGPRPDACPRPTSSASRRISPSATCPDAAAILDQQYERTKNPDRKAQFAFVRPAISADRRERDAWFASLADVANRRREPWVLEGLRYLHHPLRAAASEKYIEPSLVLLREIQRTGDIFFPKRWMDATLSGHQSAAAAATVRTFVDRLPPEYPERLRRIILSSADDLFRASRTK